MTSFQFSDFQLRSFIDPKPVELGESYIPLKKAPSVLVWLQKKKKIEIDFKGLWKIEKDEVWGFL